MPDKADHSRDHRKDQKGAGEAKSEPKRGAEADRKGKQMSQDHSAKGGQQNSGNFKNDPDRAAEAGRKGGQR